MENKPNSIALLLSMGCRLSYNLLDMSAIDYAIYYKFPEAALAMVTHEQRYVDFIYPSTEPFFGSLTIPMVIRIYNST